MICHNNMVFSVLYRGDMASTHRLVSESAQRMGAPFNVPWELETLRCLFVLLLDRDIELKRIVQAGTSVIGAMDPLRAEAFFLALRPQLIDAWMRKESLTPAELLSGARDLYLVS